MITQISERAIEVPWAVQAINNCEGSWLDVGYAFADPKFFEHVDFMGERCVGLDMVEAQHPHSFDETILADICRYQFRERFALITCISTLEHVGCDNNHYKRGSFRSGDPFAVQAAVSMKLRTACKRLLVSVPFGRYEDHGWFLQYNQGMVEKLRPTTVEYYRLGGERAEPQELADCLYRTDELRASAVALMEFV